MVDEPRGGKRIERYKNLGGDSGVAAYENGPDFIRVQFSDGSVYLYTYASADAQNIEHMKQRLGRRVRACNNTFNRQ